MVTAPGLLSRRHIASQRRYRQRRERQRGRMRVQRVTSNDVYLPPKNQLGSRLTYGTQSRVTVIKTAENLSQEVAF